MLAARRSTALIAALLLLSLFGDAAAQRRRPRMQKAPVTPCVVQPTGLPCDGDVPGGVSAIASLQDLIKAQGVAHWPAERSPVLRVGKCSVSPCTAQLAVSYPNHHTWHIGQGTLTPGTEAMVFAKIGWYPQSASSDAYYDIGERLTQPDTVTYFVAHRPQGFRERDVSEGKIIARWSLYGPRNIGQGNAVEGWIVKCRFAHPTGTVAGFIGCANAHKLGALADSMGVSFASLMQARHCMLPQPTADSLIAGTCDAQRRKAFTALYLSRRAAPRSGRDQGRGRPAPADQLPHFLASFLAAAGNEASDPYWFPCQQGCCTAMALSITQ